MDNNEDSAENQDDKVNQNPQFETVEENDIPQPIKPEEVSPNVVNAEEIQGGPPPSFDDSAYAYEESSSKIPFIIGTILFFLIVLGLVFYFIIRPRLSQPGVPTVKEPVELTYWGLWEQADIYQPLIDAYQEENKHVTINYEMMAPEQYRERLIARSQTGNGPDIFRFHNTWIPEIGEVITPLPADIMTNEAFEATFYPIHQSDLKVEQQYYGIPMSVDGMILIYNEDLLRQAGFNSPPQVWVAGNNDLLNMVKEITVTNADGELVTSGIALGTAENIEHFSETFGILLMLNGGSLEDLSAEPAVEALSLYRRFGEEEYWNEEMPNSLTAFVEGRVAMIIGPSWQVISLKAQNPDLNIKTAQIPKGLDNNQVSISSYWVDGVNRFSPHQLEAWKFLAWMSEKEQQQQLFEIQSRTRLFGSPYSRKDLGETLLDHPYLAPVIQQAQNDVYVTLPLVSRTLDNGLNDEIIQYLKNAINSTINGVDYQQALEEAQKGVTQVKEKYNPPAEATPAEGETEE